MRQAVGPEGAQALGQRVEVAARVHPRPGGAERGQHGQHQQNHQHPPGTAGPAGRRGRFRLGRPGGLAGGQKAGACGLRQVAGCAADHVQQPEGGPVRQRDRAQPAAFFAAEHQHAVPFPLGAPGGKVTAHHPAGRLRFCQRTAHRVGGVGGQMRRRLLLDLCTSLGVGIAQRPKVKDPFRPGDGLQPGLQKGPGGSIRTDEEPVVPFQFLHGGLGQRDLPGPVQVG